MSPMFGHSNETRIPNAFLEVPGAWEKYIGDVWSDLFLHAGLHFEDTIIEIAPGASKKIAFALQNLKFSGHLYLVDPVESSLQAVVLSYRELLPKATIHPIHSDLKTAFHLLPKSPHFLVANHPLDDMLIATTASSLNAEMFNCHSKTHHQSISILENCFETAINEVANTWFEVIATLNPQHVMISQYPSLILQRNKFDRLNQWASQTLKQIKAKFPEFLVDVQFLLNEHENYGDPYIGNGVLNSQHYFFLKIDLSK